MCACCASRAEFWVRLGSFGFVDSNKGFGALEQDFEVDLRVTVRGYGKAEHVEGLRARVERTLRTALHDETLTVVVAQDPVSALGRVVRRFNRAR